MVGCQAGQGHTLGVGAEAPDFALQNIQEADASPSVSLSRLVESGPVVIIFHRGLHCPICTAHLSEISEHMADFTRAGARVIAIGPDVPSEARVNLDTVGTLAVPLLADPDDKIARAYGLETAAPEFQHGTFVVDRSRHIRYAATSDEPVGTVAELLTAAKEAGVTH